MQGGHLSLIDEFTDGELLALRRKPKPSIPDWIEGFRVISGTAQVTGPLRLSMTPYFRPLLDILNRPDVTRVDLCKAAQVGGTEIMGVSLVGYYAHVEATSIMYVLADQETAAYVNRERIQPMFSDSCSLVSMMQDARRVTKAELGLGNGAYVCMAWATSVARLASRPIRVMIFDEIDKPGYYVETREADPISRGIQRTTTYLYPKIITFSTPTIEVGNIWKALDACDVVYDWHARCPVCGMYQPLRWSEQCYDFPSGDYLGEDGERHKLGQVVWAGGREATDAQMQAGGYRCGTCGQTWNESMRVRAVSDGVLSARGPGAGPRIGMHVNRLYSLLGRSGNIPGLIHQWLRTRGDLGTRQDFVNGVLAEPWRDTVQIVVDSDVLLARCDVQPRVVPDEAVALTVGIDMQLRGFWYVVRAWARDTTSWLIDYGMLADWREVERLLFGTAYPVAGRGDAEMRIWRAALDTAGGRAGGGESLTEMAYWWLRSNGSGVRGCPVFGTKGSATPIANTFKLSSVKDRTPDGSALPGGLRIVMLDTGALKDQVMYRLGLAKKKQKLGMYLHTTVDSGYARQITAEEKRIEKRGVATWIQVRKDNHLLDCECMALSCVHPQWPLGGGVQLVRQPIGLMPRGTMDILRVDDPISPDVIDKPVQKRDIADKAPWWEKSRDWRFNTVMNQQTRNRYVRRGGGAHV